MPDSRICSALWQPAHSLASVEISGNVIDCKGAASDHPYSQSGLGMPGGFPYRHRCDRVVEIRRPFQRGGLVWGRDFLHAESGAILDFPGDERVAWSQKLALFLNCYRSTISHAIRAFIFGLQPDL